MPSDMAKLLEEALKLAERAIVYANFHRRQAATTGATQWLNDLHKLRDQVAALRTTAPAPAAPSTERCAMCRHLRLKGTRPPDPHQFYEPAENPDAYE